MLLDDIRLLDTPSPLSLSLSLALACTIEYRISLLALLHMSVWVKSDGRELKNMSRCLLGLAIQVWSTTWAFGTGGSIAAGLRAKEVHTYNWLYATSVRTTAGVMEAPETSFVPGC
jgi:hypothetical protein